VGLLHTAGGGGRLAGRLGGELLAGGLATRGLACSLLGAGLSVEGREAGMGRGRTVRKLCCMKLCCMASEIVLLMLLLLLLTTHSALLQGARGVQITRRSLRLKKAPRLPQQRPNYGANRVDRVGTLATAAAALMRTSRRTILLSNLMENVIRPRATISKTKGHSNWPLPIQHELRPAAFHTPYLKDEGSVCRAL
jgi:hypothetical protein